LYKIGKITQGVKYNNAGYAVEKTIKKNAHKQRPQIYPRYVS